MEIELKFELQDLSDTDALLADEAVAGHILSRKTLTLKSEYFDTEDGLLSAQKAALRLRRENERTVGCFKCTVRKEGALAVREEYECDAADLADALCRLPEAGAPRVLFDTLRSRPLVPIAAVECTREAIVCAYEEFSFELALDRGAFLAPDRRVPFFELELELLSGDSDRFVSFVRALEARFSLKAQHASKLQRARTVYQTRG